MFLQFLDPSGRRPSLDGRIVVAETAGRFTVALTAEGLLFPSQPILQGIRRNVFDSEREVVINDSVAVVVSFRDLIHVHADLLRNIRRDRTC